MNVDKEKEKEKPKKRPAKVLLSQDSDDDDSIFDSKKVGSFVYFLALYNIPQIAE